MSANERNERKRAQRIIVIVASSLCSVVARARNRRKIRDYRYYKSIKGFYTADHICLNLLIQFLSPTHTQVFFFSFVHN